MRAKLTATAAAICAAWLLSCSSAQSTIAQSEDFEGYVPGPNIIQHPDLGSFLIPGNVVPFVFKSGVELTNPIPNPGSLLGGFPDIQGVVLGDWSLHGPGPDGASFCFEIDCVSGEWQLPSGSGYLAYNGLASHGPVTFELPGTMALVGAYVTGASDVSMTAYDSLGNVIDETTIGQVLAVDWINNFIELTDPGIASVSFSGDFFVLDNLTFATSADAEIPVLIPRPPPPPPPLPEPATLALFGAGLAAAIAMRRRKRKPSQREVKSPESRLRGFETGAG